MYIWYISQRVVNSSFCVAIPFHKLMMVTSADRFLQQRTCPVFGSVRKVPSSIPVALFADHCAQCSGGLQQQQRYLFVSFYSEKCLFQMIIFGFMRAKEKLLPNVVKSPLFYISRATSNIGATTFAFQRIFFV
jgi:hypothetical protein